MSDYILFVVLFVFFLVLAYLTTSPSVLGWLPANLQDLQSSKLNFIFRTALTLASIPIIVLFTNNVDATPENAGWNRKNSMFVVILILLFAIRLESWFRTYFLVGHFYEIFGFLNESPTLVDEDNARDGDYTRATTRDKKRTYYFDEKVSKLVLNGSVWKHVETVIRMFLFPGLVLTMSIYMSVLQSDVTAPGTAPYKNRWSYIGLITVAGLITALDLYYTSSKLEWTREATKKFMRTKKSQIHDKLMLFSNVPKNKTPPGQGFDIKGEVFHISGVDDKVFNTKKPSHAAIKHLIESKQKKIPGKDLAILINTSGNTLNEGYYLSTKQHMIKTLGPARHQTKREVFDLGASGKVTVFETSEKDEESAEKTFMHGYSITAFVMFHLGWSIIFLESLKRGVAFWLVSNIVPVVVACVNPHHWWAVYTANQLAVFNFGWMFERIEGVAEDQKYLFGNMSETYSFTDAAASPTKNNQMGLILEQTDVVMVYALCLCLLPMATGVVQHFMYKSKE